jgi:hypothetical protein
LLYIKFDHNDKISNDQLIPHIRFIIFYKYLSLIFTEIIMDKNLSQIHFFKIVNLKMHTFIIFILIIDNYYNLNNGSKVYS